MVYLVLSYFRVALEFNSAYIKHKYIPPQRGCGFPEEADVEKQNYTLMVHFRHHGYIC